ncbi:unnamed protein product [Closterium sp. NIES-65]|nr:unnamed protein product [Closterium sp. NIES-65]
MYITLYYIVTRLPDSLRSVTDHFLSICPTTLTVDLLEERLLAAEKSIVAVGASRGDPRAPVFEGCSPSPHLPSLASVAAVDFIGTESVGAASAPSRLWWWSAQAAAAHSGPHPTQRCFGRLTDAWRLQFPDATKIPRWGELQRSGVAIFDLDYDAILAAMYAVSTSDEGDCYLCVPPDPGIEAAALGAGEAAALGASASAAPGAGESALSGTTSAQALHTFTLDSGASRSYFRDRTTLTPLSRPVAVSQADPSGGPVLAHFSTVLPCPAVPSGTLSGLYLPSFSTNLVSGADLQDGGVDQFTPASQRVTHCTCAGTGRHLATFTRRPGSSLCLLWHHRLGHPSLPRLRGMASRVLVSGLPRSLSPLPPGPAPTCIPCVEGRQRAAPHSSEFPPTEAPLQTLHMDVWGPARVRGQGQERYFLLVVDDYSRYTTVFPLHSKGVVTKTFMLPASPQQNGIAERRTGMVMDVARTSMIHAAAPHFLWPFAVRYAALQINLQPRVSLPETSPTLRWTGKVSDASAFRVWGSRAWQFYHPTSRHVPSPQDVTFYESVPYYRLFPYRTAPLPPPPLFLTPGPPLVDPLPPLGPAPSGVSQVDAVEPVESLGVLGVGVRSLGVLSLGVPSLGVRSLGVLSLGERSLRVLGLLVWPLAVLGLGSLRVLRRGGSYPLHRSSASSLPGAGAVLLELEVLLLLLTLGSAPELQEPLVLEVFVPAVLELLGLGVLLRLLELMVLLELVLLELDLLGVLALEVILALVLLRVLKLALLELEVLLALVLSLGVLVLSLLVLEALRGRGCTHQMALRSSTAPLRVPLPSPPESSLPVLADPESDSRLAASPSVTRLLASVVTDPSFESTAVSALVAELVDFATRYRQDYAASLVAESESVCPPSVGGECALSTDVLEDRQEEF